MTELPDQEAGSDVAFKSNRNNLKIPIKDIKKIETVDILESNRTQQYKT